MRNLLSRLSVHRASVNQIGRFLEQLDIAVGERSVQKAKGGRDKGEEGKELKHHFQLFSLVFWSLDGLKLIAQKVPAAFISRDVGPISVRMNEVQVQGFGSCS